MSTDFNSVIDTTITSENKLNLSTGRVARFSYEDQALTEDHVAGTESYDYNQDNNIPLPDDLQMSATILSKGLRSQASSFTRMAVNHFFGRTSYNVNKLAEHLKNFLTYFKNFLNEGDNLWTATSTYKTGDVVYFLSSLNGGTAKRTFACLQENTNLPPVDSATGALINTAYWNEIGNNFPAIKATSATVNGTLTVNGDIIQNGSAYETHAEKLYTKKDTIITRDGAVSGLATGEYSGVQVNKYDGTHSCGLVVDNTGTARVGEYEPDNNVDDTQPLLTRPDEGSPQLQNGGVLVWNNVTKRAETTNLPTAVTLTVSTNTTIQDYTTNVMVKVNGSGVTLTMGAITDFGEVTVFALYDTIIAFNSMTDTLYAYDTCKLQYINGVWFVTSNESAGDVKASASDKKPFGSLSCDGVALTGSDETKYPRLWKKLTVSDGQGGETGLYNLPTDPSTIRRLPDYRESVLVGAGQSTRAEIAEHDAYTLGEFKDDQLQGHFHGLRQTGGSETTVDWFPLLATQQTHTATFPASVTSPTSDGTNGTPRTGTTTHGKQIGVNYVIKY